MSSLGQISQEVGLPCLQLSLTPRLPPHRAGTGPTLCQDISLNSCHSSGATPRRGQCSRNRRGGTGNVAVDCSRSWITCHLLQRRLEVGKAFVSPHLAHQNYKGMLSWSLWKFLVPFLNCYKLYFQTWFVFILCNPNKDNPYSMASACFNGKLI